MGGAAPIFPSYTLMALKGTDLNWQALIVVITALLGGACGAYGAGRGVYRVLVGKPEGKRPLGRPRRSWEDNIKMAL